MSKDKTTLSIPTELYKRIEESVAGSGSDSVLDAVIRVLEEKWPAAEEFSAEDEEKVKARLKALGYMD